MLAVSLPCQLVALHTISFNDEWSLHPWELSTIPDGLLQSFYRTGILHKPILLAKEDGCFDILCGFKRLQFALFMAQMDSVECLVLSDEVQPATILDILLTDQSISHSLSLAEKARFVEICARFLTHQDIVSSYLERLHLREKLSTIKELNSILQLDPLILAEIHAGRLQEKMVGELLRLKAISDQIALVQFFRKLALGDGKQQRFFTLIRDISSRNGSTIAALIKSQGFADILDHPELNVPQKVEHLKNLLQQQLSPMYLRAEAEFIKQVRNLQLPPQCIIAHSPSFEKDDITFSITFKKLADCVNMIPRINKLLNKSDEEQPQNQTPFLEVIS
jgi:hypothetical protein